VSRRRRKRAPVAALGWPVHRPAEVYARMPDMTALDDALRDDPFWVAMADQVRAAHAEVVDALLATPPGELARRAAATWERDVHVTVKPDGPNDRERIGAWLLCALVQAGRRGLRGCPHVFLPGACGYLHVGHAIAACFACAHRDLALAREVAVGDDRCEVCGERQRPAWFHTALVPIAGILIQADQCTSCHEWLMAAVGGRR
jgi:hypothetical protein